MIEVHITMTSKGYGRGETFRIFHEETKRFDTLDEARAFLKQQYGNCKRVPMCRDKQDGTTVRAGWVYGFRNADLSHAPVQKWIQQDWVSLSECKPIEWEA